MGVELFAPPEYWKMGPQEKCLKCNGCGPKGFGVIIPDHLLFLKIRQLCDIHDFCYSIGVTIKDKEEADRIFLNNMLRLIDSTNGFKVVKKIRRWLAYRVYGAVSRYGGPWYWAGKNPDYNIGTVEIGKAPKKQGP